MEKLKRIIEGVVLLLMIYSTCLAQEPPHIPGTELQWGMTYEHIHEAYPDAKMGTIEVYHIQFAEFPTETHPTTANVFIPEGGGLEYVQFSPLYTYENPTDWNADYGYITSYMNDVYGDPYDTSDDMVLWVTTETQGKLMMNSIVSPDDQHRQENGWLMRFDTRE